MSELNSIVWSQPRDPKFCQYLLTFQESNHSVCLTKRQFTPGEIGTVILLASYVFWKCLCFWRRLARWFANSPTWQNYYLAMSIAFAWMLAKEPNISWVYLFVLTGLLVIFVDCPLYLGRKLGIIAEYTTPIEPPDSTWTPSFPEEPSSKCIR